MAKSLDLSEYLKLLEELVRNVGSSSSQLGSAKQRRTNDELRTALTETEQILDRKFQEVVP